MKLRHVLLLIISLIMVGQFAWSQPSKSTWLTTSAGLNSTWIINQNTFGNPDIEYGTKFGLSAELGLNYYLDTKWGLSTGIGFANLGQSYHGVMAEAKTERKLNMNYIMVPLYVMRQLRDPREPTWFTFGPQIMILTSAKQKFSREDGGSELINEAYLLDQDLAKYLKPVDLMLNLGITNLYYMRTNDKMRLMLGFNTALGLLDMNNKDYRFSRRNSAYHGSHNFYLGVKCGLMFNP